MAAPEWVEEGLRSGSPSVRLKASAWLKSNPDAVTLTSLMRALQNEPVPQIRRILNDVLESRQLASAQSIQGRTMTDSSQSAIPELARLIRHELSPPIGWARRAGGREIDNFARSATNDALNRLERRVDALISLIKSDDDLAPVTCNLESLLRESWPDFNSEPRFTSAADLGDREVVIETDVGLFEILLANAYQNAIDASIEIDGAQPIGVSWSQVGEHFWVRISNAFRGNQFDIKDVQATGISTKIGHQGVGISLVKTAAVRLNYGFRVVGQSGLATFTLTGGTKISE